MAYTPPPEMGPRIAKLREAAGLSQQALADSLNVTRATVTGIETGGKPGSLGLLVAVADYFRVPIDFLLGRKTRGNSEQNIIKHPEDLRIVAIWRALSVPEKKIVAQMLLALTAGDSNTSGGERIVSSAPTYRARLRTDKRRDHP